MVTLREHLSDDALVARLCDKDTTAFTILYDRHSRLAFRLANRLLDNSSAAEDVVQDTFLSLWRNAGAFQPQRLNARGWLLVIVRHRVIDELRKTRSRRLLGSREVEETEDIDQSIDVEHDVCVALEAMQVRDALATLPHEQQQILALRYYGGLSQTEIARKLAIPLGTVKNRQRSALLKLRRIMTGVGRLRPGESSGRSAAA
jgi:RNA polymerase sigma-70 factor (ECF subfamily)